MSKQLSVNERSIKEFLSSGEKNSFLIPDYQRDYEWKKDQIDLLFDDLTEFTRSMINSNGDEKYFLGTIVSYVNDNGDREIIDGQQRIVSLLLLLRAIYTKLSPPKNVSRNVKGRLKKIPSDDVEDRLKEIRTALWRKIKKTSSEVDYTKNYIRSESIDDNYKDVLQSILTNGTAPRGKSCDYSRNYNRLKNHYRDLYDADQTTAEEFIYYLLNETIVFSIEAESRDTALTIFSTINNRGKPLSAANILRADIYKYSPDENKDTCKIFWGSFVERAERQIGVSAEDIFTQYMYYLRAKNDDDDGTTIGVQTYFTQNKSERLKDRKLFQTLELILNVWEVAKKREQLEGEPWSRDIETLKIFDMMSMFRDMSWRGAAVVYYLAHRKESNFVSNFRAFMRKLFSQYVPLYMFYRDSTFLREDILKLNIRTLKSNQPQFSFSRNKDVSRLKTEIISAKYFQRLMLKAYAYGRPEQTELLPNKFLIEHVFDGSDEQLGNLTLIEQSLSERLENRSFARKKEEYIESTIAMTRALVDEANEWTPDSIAIRSDRLAESLIELRRKWSDDYDQAAG